MVEATSKYYDQLVDAKTDVKMPDPPGDMKAWMIFVRPGAPDQKKTTGGGVCVPIRAKVLEHDEGSQGGVSNTQTVIPIFEVKKMDVVAELPWTEWIKLDTCKEAGGTDGDIATAVAVLRMLSLHAHSATPIKMMYNATDKQVRVLATKQIKAKELRLPPCCQKLKVYETSTNPRRVTIKVTRTKSIADASNAAEAAADGGKKKKSSKQDPAAAVAAAAAAVTAEKERVVTASSRDYYIHPEWRLPAFAEDTKIFTLADDTSVYPFWAIQRLTEEQIKKMNQEQGGRHRKINCEVEYVQYTNCSVGVLTGDSVAMTTYVTVPMVTNRLAVEEGEELILAFAQKQKDIKRKDQTWKTDAASASKKAKPLKNQDNGKSNSKDTEI